LVRIGTGFSTKDKKIIGAHRYGDKPGTTGRIRSRDGQQAKKARTSAGRKIRLEAAHQVDDYGRSGYAHCFHPTLGQDDARYAQLRRESSRRTAGPPARTEKQSRSSVFF